LFKPNPKGAQANASNLILDMLMEVSETKRSTLTFILAGYKEDMKNLILYNEGFRSRFPEQFKFDFENFTEAQLTKIMYELAKSKGFRFESKKECNVKIALVLCRRLHANSGKKGFGNARDVRSELGKCILAQEARLAKFKIENNLSVIPDHMYRTLTRADTVGERPQLDDSPYMRQLDAMVGMEDVKKTVRSLLNLQLQNFDNEMNGEKVVAVSINRLFLGPPGTGKTTGKNDTH